MKINLEKFLERLKELQGDGSVAALARRIGIRQNTFDLYIKGLRKPSVELVFSIIHNCNVSFEWLFGLSDVRARPHTSAGALPPIVQPTSHQPSTADLLAEIRELKSRVRALESSAGTTFACC